MPDADDLELPSARLPFGRDHVAGIEFERIHGTGGEVARRMERLDAAVATEEEPASFSGKSLARDLQEARTQPIRDEQRSGRTRLGVHATPLRCFHSSTRPGTAGHCSAHIAR